MQETQTGLTININVHQKTSDGATVYIVRNWVDGQSGTPELAKASELPSLLGRIGAPALAKMAGLGGFAQAFAGEIQGSAGVIDRLLGRGRGG